METLYLGEGFLLPSPAHPLHDAFYASPDRPVERIDRRCAQPRTDHGRLADPVDETVDRFEVAGSLWQIDARTVIRAPEVAGAPRLVRGDTGEHRRPAVRSGARSLS